MRLLHIADVHLERSFAWLGPGYGPGRREGLRATLARVVDLARDRDVDALVIAGDLFDRENAGPRVGKFLGATFARLGDRPVLISPGNHDFFTPGCLYDQVSWSPNVHIFRSATPTPVSVGDGTVWGYAFTGPERHISPLDNFTRPPGDNNVALLHADLVDPSQTSIYAPLTSAEIDSAGFRWAMLGHVHAGQIDEAQRFAYPGSLEPLDVSEVGPRNALLVEATAGSLHVEAIPVADRHVLSEEIDVTPFNTFDDLQRFVDERQAAWEHAEVRLRVVGTLTGELEDVETTRGVFRALGVALDLVAEPSLDIVALADQRTILGAFVRDTLAQKKAAIKDEQKIMWSDVLRVGVAAFRGRMVTL